MKLALKANWQSHLPIIVMAAMILSSVALEIARGQTIPRRPQGYKRPDELLVTTMGVRITAVHIPERRVTAAFVMMNGQRTSMPDGSYRLTNGGAIRVSRGIIVWDAFGVAEALQKGLIPGTNNG
jgi:hypothetical protein